MRRPAPLRSSSEFDAIVMPNQNLSSAEIDAIVGRSSPDRLARSLSAIVGTEWVRSVRALEHSLRNAGVVSEQSEHSENGLR
jgi:hypothetical protein